MGDITAEKTSLALAVSKGTFIIVLLRLSAPRLEFKVISRSFLLGLC